jgi:hypothetical protein
MSGLIKFKFGFENLLKIGFEKLEKEKEKRNPFHSEFGPFLSAAQRTRPAVFPRPLPLGPSPASGRRPSFTARARFPAPASLTARTHVSGASSSPRRRIPFPLFPDPIPSPQSSPFLL